MSKSEVLSEANPASGAKAQERRRRKRVKVAAKVRVRSTDLSAPVFTEIAATVDVSRDGLLFTTSRREFWKGMPLGVTFPYSDAPGALNAEQQAEVVRTVELAGAQMRVAVKFAESNSKAAAASAGARAGAGESQGRERGASSHRAHGRGAAHSAARRPLVVAVESEPRGRETLKSLLEPEGYEVRAVATGEEALEILRQAVPAVFIAEVEAAETSGFDLCLIVKNDERLARVPVVLLTRNAQPADYAAGHNFGAVICMAKPFKPERLLQVVRLVAPPPPKSGASPYGSSRGEASLLERNL